MTDSSNYLDFFSNPLGVISVISICLILIMLNNLIKKRTQKYLLVLSNFFFWKEALSSWNKECKKHMDKLIRDKSKFSLFEYAQRLFYYRRLIINANFENQSLAAKENKFLNSAYF